MRDVFGGAAARGLALVLACSTGWAVPAAAAGYRLLHSFGADGDGLSPEGALLAQGNLFYGTTEGGGAHNEGTLFSLDPVTHAETVLYSFGGSAGVFPVGALIAVHGVLYGTTYYGGTGHCPINGIDAGCGTVFSFDPATGTEKVVYSFQGGGDGASPSAGLIAFGGLLYGTTAYGGSGPCTNDGYDAPGCGTVFSIDPSTDAERVVHTFAGFPADGAYPYAALVAAGSTVYGTTERGGPGGNVGGGTVFALVPATGAVSILHSFGNAGDGYYPGSELVLFGGLLYGTTQYGGMASGSPYGFGTVYSVDPSSGAEAVVYSFQGKDDGAYPRGGLAVQGGLLYGVNSSVFSLDPTTGTEKVLRVLQGRNHSDSAPIVLGKWLYGTTVSGGTYALGTVFAVKR